MKCIRLGALLFLAITWALSLELVFAQQVQKHSLADLLSVALEHNQEIQVRFHDWQKSLHQVLPAKSLKNPELTYAYYIDEVETRVGAQKQSASLMQAFPFPGKLSRKKKIALEQAKQKQAIYEQHKQIVMADVKKTYYEYVYTQNAITVTELNLKLLQNLEQVAQTKYKTGIAENQDLLKAQVELGKMSDQLLSLKDYQRVIDSKLKSLLAWPKEKPLNVQLSSSELPKALRLKPNFLDENFELKQLRYAIDEGLARESLAKQQYLPDFALGVTYIQTDERNLAIDDNGKDPVIAQVKVSLPIWFNTLKEELEAARSFKAMSQKKHRSKTDQLQAELSELSFKVEDRRRKMTLYKDALIPKAEQTLKTIETNYRSGKASFLDLIDAQRTLLSFQLSYYRARADHFQSLAELDVLRGGKINEN